MVVAEHAWLGLAEASKSLLKELEAKPWDAFHVYLSHSPTIASGDHHPELTSFVVQIVPKKDDHQEGSCCSEVQTLLLHPLMFNFFVKASDASFRGDGGLSSAVEVKGGVFLRELPIFPSVLPRPVENHCQKWATKRLPTKDAACGTVILVKIIYLVDEGPDGQEQKLDNLLHHGLEGRVVMKGTTTILFTSSGYMIIAVLDVQLGDKALQEDVAWRLGAPNEFATKMIEPSPGIRSAICQNIEPLTNKDDCPGYEHLREEVLSLVCLKGSYYSPSGVLLSGSAGIGKTKLAFCVSCILSGKGWAIHWVSIQDLLLRASWASEEDMLSMLLPSRKSSAFASNTLVVFDDLNTLTEVDEQQSDSELTLTRNSLLKAVDKLVRQSIPILGISQTPSLLPADLVKIGRFEKEVPMLPPTQRQREQILSNLLQESHPKCNATCEHWAELLAPVTAGCVAADLRHLCSDAWTRACARTGNAFASASWIDMRKAAQCCIPSQLAELDVTKPDAFVGTCSRDDWRQIHRLSWRNFAGYDDSVKKLVYRSVVVPWQRHLCTKLTKNKPSSERIAPPSGVLFHGPSGCGKTLAAKCLGSSLGLPMIKVRAADVLDKWLGGSEANIRSLFARARAAAPCILFFDEIDAIASNRANDGETTDVMSRLLSTLLNEMDGVSSERESNVLVIACTNRLDTLDAALLRPGRLEEHILLSYPSLDDVTKILQLYLNRVPLHDDIELKDTAFELVSCKARGADVEGVAREAVFRAMRRLTQSIVNISVTSVDFRDAISGLKLHF